MICNSSRTSTSCSKQQICQPSWTEYQEQFEKYRKFSFFKYLSIFLLIDLLFQRNMTFSQLNMIIIIMMNMMTPSPRKIGDKQESMQYITNKLKASCPHQ